MKKIIANTLFFIVLLSNFVCFGQQVKTKQYSFVNLKGDTIVYYGNSKRMFDVFFDKFRSMIISGREQVNILHIGDSHLQADLMSGEIRKNFQSFFFGLEGSRGMVTPYKKGAPDSYKLTFSPNWTGTNIISSSDAENKGLWGTSVYTAKSKETITINVNNRNPIKYDFNRFRVYHSPLQPNDNLKINNTDIAYQEIYNKEEGFTEFVLSDYVGSVEIEIQKKGTENFYVYGFYFQDDNAGVVYNVTGTNGASAFHYNKNAKLFSSQIKSLNFDFIIISLGTNDTYEAGGVSNFGKELTILISSIRNIYPDIPILLTTPSECWWHRRKINPRMPHAIETIKQVAKETNCAVFDLYNVLGGYNSAKKLQNNLLMQRDLVHLTPNGYTLAGDLIYNALWSEIDKNLPKQ